MLKKNQKGFSIIELIVVVAIICLISAISYPNIMKWYTKNQYNTKCIMCKQYNNYYYKIIYTDLITTMEQIIRLILSHYIFSSLVFFFDI